MSTNRLLHLLIVAGYSPLRPVYPIQRQPELSESARADVAIDLTDYFVGDPELRVPQTSNDLSDYFLRH